ncbi:unnamed protein product [marine sediment metagenome]|uniref:Uncharacterized protein n=1 Tax=marine sediment metagenome TaxID=412755 RepID=X0WBW2_9ZZZZ
MPRKLRKEKQRTRLTLDDLTIEEFLCFQVGWHPPETDFERRCVRWESFEEFDAAYELLRDQRHSPLWFGTPTFAEERYQAARRAIVDD